MSSVMSQSFKTVELIIILLLPKNHRENIKQTDSTYILFTKHAPNEYGGWVKMVI